MSQENVEVVRRHIEAWNERDLMTLLTVWHSDAEIDWSRSRGPLKGVYCGHRALETFWNEFWSTFEKVQVEMHGFTEGGSEVVTSNTAHMLGRDGIEVIARSTYVYTVENGQITRFGCFKSEPKLSKPPACRSKTLTPPELARYCVAISRRDLERRENS